MPEVWEVALASLCSLLNVGDGGYKKRGESGF